MIIKMTKKHMMPEVLLKNLRSIEYLAEMVSVINKLLTVQFDVRAADRRRIQTSYSNWPWPATSSSRSAT